VRRCVAVEEQPAWLRCLAVEEQPAWLRCLAVEEQPAWLRCLAVAEPQAGWRRCLVWESQAAWRAAWRAESAALPWPKEVALALTHGATTTPYTHTHTLACDDGVFRVGVSLAGP